MIAALTDAGALIARGRLKHQYPHSWRSKKPVIFRNTPQWFIGMGDGEPEGLRRTALDAIDATRFFPAAGRNRLYAMIEQRPDWVISRQRAWGVPIAVFADPATGDVLNDPAVNARIVDAFREESSDAWFRDGARDRFLGDEHKDGPWEKVDDILDVWFESGCTHAFCLEQEPDELVWPASLYLEGSDQHRGWFHSSLLESCGTRGRAPYDAVLTHGFVTDEDGRKMSKSLGNVTAPQEICDRFGADILRLWVVASDYSEDLRIGPEIVKQQADTYRRLRNTLRFILGNVAGFSEQEKVASSRHAGAGALGTAPAPYAGRRLAKGVQCLSSFTATMPRCTISAPPSCRPSISISERTRSTAIGRTTCGGARRAPCWISCSIA